MEDILAIVFIFGGGSLFLLAISPIGKAIAERIRGGAPNAPGAVQGALEGLLEDGRRPLAIVASCRRRRRLEGVGAVC